MPVPRWTFLWIRKIGLKTREFHDAASVRVCGCFVTEHSACRNETSRSLIELDPPGEQRVQLSGHRIEPGHDVVNAIGA
jgi:hypothetical protein